MLVPQISILTPIKNAGPWVGECAASILNQSLTSWEWIVVDDQSNDHSIDVLSKLAATDGRIRIHKNAGSGIIPALQKALSLARAPQVSRMDADDIMPPERLKSMHDALNNQGPKTLVTGMVSYFPRSNLSTGYRSYENWLNSLLTTEDHWNNLYRECVVASPNWLVRKDELEASGGFRDLTYPEDYDLCFRLYAQGWSIHKLRQTTLCWREHAQRTSRNSEHYSQKYFFSLKMRRFLALDYQKDNQICLWGTGIKARLAASFLREAGVSFRWMDLSERSASIKGHKIESYRQVIEIRKPQVLLAVYPHQEQRIRMESWLAEHQLRPGREYWYL